MLPSSSSAFVAPLRLPLPAKPLPSKRRALSSLPQTPPFLRGHAPPQRSRPAVYHIVIPVAVQARPASGDSDGEVRDQVDPSQQMSFSVGLTIVSGCDAQLRRSVVERIVAEGDVGRVVVVTTSGITSTEEQDGIVGTPTAPPPAHSEADAQDELAEAAAPINGFSHDAAPDVEPVVTSPAVSNLEGWISCSSANEMVEVVLKLAKAHDCDYIIAESSVDASMEPQDLAHILHDRGGSTLRIDSLVAVLDGTTLLQDLSAIPQPDSGADVDGMPPPQDVAVPSQDESAPASSPIQDVPAPRPMIAVSLVENANVIVVRQGGTEPDEELSRVQEVISVLNASACVVRATDEKVPVDLLINTRAYDDDSLRFIATWRKVILATRNAKDASKPVLPKSVKEAAFLYKARRPFHPERLYAQIKAVATFTGVIRSTGRIWLATRMLAPLEWNQAGVAATLRLGKLFWAARPESEWPSGEEQREAIMSNWDTQYGDRETEIVFVGKGIDKVRLQGLLDGCLLQDEEMVFTNAWENFEDPFVEWVPLIDDDEEAAMEEELQRVEVKVQPVPESSAVLDTNGADTDEPQASVEQVITGDVAVGEQEPPKVVEEVRQDNASAGIDEAHGQDPAVEVSADALSDESSVPNDGVQDMRSAEIESQNASVQQVNRNEAEGEIDSDEIPDRAYEQLSALDVFTPQEGSSLVPQPKDDGSFDEDDVVIASWDGSVADGILMQMPRIGLPVTLVTGFLGSGKTTLLNYILTANHGLKIAVLVNEFGEIDIDNQLVEKGDWSVDDEVLQLANGCICCSINDSFVTAVSKILERADEIDYLIVETTGVADPVPVINSLMVSDLMDDVRVDGILTLVDAENFDPDTQMNSEAALSQITAADTILLSKTDIASASQVARTIEFIKRVRPAARILKSQRGRVPIDMILDVGTRVSDSPAHLNPVKEALEQYQEQERIPHKHEHEHGRDHPHSHDHDEHAHHDHDHNHDHDHGHNHDHDCGPDCDHESHQHGHLESDGFVTTSFKSDRALDAELFMNNFLQQLPEGVFRAKGLLSFYGYSKRYVFQLSGRRYQVEEDDWPEGAAPGNQLVIIGRDLDLEQLRKTLENCHAVGAA